MKMRKSLLQFAAISTLAAGVLAGCSGSSSGSSDSSSSNKNEVKVWVQFSDETAEGKAWQEIVDGFNKEHEGEYKVVTEYIPVAVVVADMRIRSTLL